jgi:hypothetical protein
MAIKREDLISSVLNKVRQTFNDNKGFIQQGRLTAKPIRNAIQNWQQKPSNQLVNRAISGVKQSPVYQFGNSVITGIKKSPVPQFGNTLGMTAFSPIASAKNKQDSQQYSNNINTALKMASLAKTPEERQRWMNLAGSSQSLQSGQANQFQQQYNKTGLQIAGEGLGTAATVIGGPKMALKTTLTQSLLGGVLNKAMGGSFGEGFGTSLGYAPAFQGVASLTNPYLSKAMQFSPVKGEIAKRGTAGLLNVAQGAVQDVATGQKTNLASAGIDFGLGVINPQFGSPDVKVKGIFKNAKKIDEFTAAEVGNLQYKIEKGIPLKKKDLVDLNRIWDRYIGKETRKGNKFKQPEFKIRELVNEIDRQYIPNLSMGFVDKQEPISTPQNKTPMKLTEEEYLAQNGAGFLNGAEPALHHNRVNTKYGQSRLAKQALEEMTANDERRKLLRIEYADKVKSGEIVQPNKIDILIKTANGQEDNPAVQAARRLLEKRGISWENLSKQEPISTLENKPLTVYHGTRNEFNEFDDTKLGTNTEWLNSKWGHFFTEDENIAKRFLSEDTNSIKDTRTGRIIKAQIDLKKPLDFTPEGLTTKKEQAQIIYEAMTGKKVSPDKALSIVKDAYNEAAGMAGLNDFYDEIYGNLKIKELAQKNGYDGLISHYGELNGKDIKEYAVFSANQIKSQISPEVKPSLIDKKVDLGYEIPKEPELKQRGFSASVQEAPNVSKQVKQDVLGGYESKPNDVLMQEAKALLEEGVTLDIKNIKDIDKKVAATMQEAINQQAQGNHQAAANLFNNLSEQGTELGRGVQAFSLLQNMSPEAIALSAAGKIKKYNQTAKVKIPELTGEQVKLISDKVQAADLLKGEDKNKALFEINQLINEFIPSSIADKALTVWKAGLLTSLRTHLRNTVGNTVHGTTEFIKDIPATLTDMALSGKTGKRTITITGKGIDKAWSKDTVSQMRSILGSGYDPEKIIEKFDSKQITWGKDPIQQGLKKYTDTVFRLLGAEDKPFYNASMARSLYSQAGAEAINQGQRGNKAFIDNLVKNPTDDMIKTAIGDANVATFKDKNKATEIAGALKRAMATTQVGKVVSEITMPFTGVPGSVLGQIINYSPAGLIKGIYNAGKVALGNMPELQRQASQEVGRGVVGTGIFALGSYLMSKGLMTGQPENATEARQWELENKPRNSIMIGGKWRSLNSIGPEAVVFLAGAKLNEELNSEEGNLGTYGVKLGKDYLDQSFVQGLQGPVNAITDPQRYAKSYVGNMATSFVPNIVKDLSKATDPSMRETNTIGDYVKQSIPGLRRTLTERRDVLGNVIKQEPGGLAAFYDMFNSKTPISNDVVNELSRLNNAGENATPSKLIATQTIRGEKIKLTPKELNQLELGAGEIATSKIDSLIKSRAYQQLSDENKADAIKKVVTDTRKQYKNLGTGTETSMSGGTGENYGYVDDSGNYKTVNIDKVSNLPEQTNYQRALKQKEAFKLIDDVMDNLSGDEQISALNALGISAEDATYYNTARQENYLKSIYVEEEIMGMIKSGQNKDQILNTLAGMRKAVNEKILLADGVINDLVDKNIISYQDGKMLKNIDKDLKPKKAKAKKPKKISLSSKKFTASRKKYNPLKVKTSSTKTKFKPPKYVKADLRTSFKLL